MHLTGLRLFVGFCTGLGLILALPGCSFRLAVPPEMLGEASSPVPTVTPRTAVPQTPIPTEIIALIPTETAFPTATPTSPPPEPTPLAGGLGRILLQCMEEPLAWLDLYVYDPRSREYSYANPGATRDQTEHVYDIFVSASQNGSQLAWQETDCYDIIKSYNASSKITRPKCGYSETRNYLSDPIFSVREEVSYLPYIWLLNGLVVEFRPDPAAQDKVQILLVDTSDGSEQNLGLIFRNRFRQFAQSSPDGRYALIPLYTHKAEYNGYKVEQFLLIDSQSGQTTKFPSPSRKIDEVLNIFWLPDSSGFRFKATSSAWLYNRFYQGNLDGTQYSVLGESGLSFALSPDQRWLAYVSLPDTAVRLRDLSTGTETTLINPRKHNQSIYLMQFDPQNENLYAFSMLDGLQRVNLSTKEITILPGSLQKPGQMLTWSPDGRWYLLNGGTADTSYSYGTTYESYLCNTDTCEILRPPGTVSCIGAFWLKK
jgi:hypothetical protein